MHRAWIAFARTGDPGLARATTPPAGDDAVRRASAEVLDDPDGAAAPGLGVQPPDMLISRFGAVDSGRIRP